MSDPEPPSYDRALHQIRNTYSTARLEAQGEYLRANASHYSRTELDDLFNAIEKQLMKLNPEPTEYNCARIAEIQVIYTPEGNGYTIRPESRTHPLNKYCILAYEEGKRLSEYITDLEELGGGRVYDLRYTFQRPTATIRGLQAEEEEVEAEHREVGITPRPSEAEARVNIDIADIFNRLQRQIDERFEELQNQIRSGVSPAQTDELRRRIDELEQQKDKLQSQYSEVIGRVEREQKIKTYEANLTAKEYGVFQKQYEQYFPGLRPYTFHTAGKGYDVRIEYETPEEEKAIHDFIAYVHREGKPSERTVNPISNSPLVDKLCAKFEEVTGNKCGISRYQALTTLAEGIMNYIDTYNEKHPGKHELDLQAVERFINEINLFAGKGTKVYLGEMAQQALDSFVLNVQRSQMSEEQRQASQPLEMEQEYDICVPEVMYPEFVDIYVYLEKRDAGTATENDRRAYERALKDLEPCGYSAEKYGEWLDEAVTFFSNHGQDFYKIVNEMIGPEERYEGISEKIYHYIGEGGHEGRTLQEISSTFESEDYPLSDIDKVLNDLASNGEIYEYALKKYRVV